MTTSTSTSSTAAVPSAHAQFIGVIVQVAGVAAVVGGLILSLHHWPAAAALIGGATAFYVGKKLRGQ